MAATLAASYTGVPLSGVQLAAYALALVALTLAAIWFDRCLSPASQTAALPFCRLDALLLVAVTGSALWLRVYHIDRLSSLIGADEIAYLKNAISLLQGTLVSPFASGDWDAVYVHAYSIAASTLVFPDRAVALRMVGVVPGVLSIPLEYLFLRQLFNNRVIAFSGSLLLALSSWHVMLSRRGYHWSINGFLELIALYWLARALRTGRLRHFVLSGFGLGLGVLYTYSAALLPIAFVLFAGYLLVVHRSLITRRFLLGFVLLTLAASVVAGPRLTAILAHPEMFTRHDDVSVLAPRHVGQAGPTVLRQFQEILVSFNFRSDENLGGVRPGKPLLDPVTAAALGLGAFIALWRARKAGWALLLLSSVVLLLPSVLSTGETTWATTWRANGVVPGLFGLAAAPFAVVWQQGAGRQLTRTGLIALCALTLGVVGLLNYRYYFEDYPKRPNWNTGLMAAYMRGIDRLLETPPDTRLLANYDMAGHGYLDLLTYGRRSVEVFNWPSVDLIPLLLGEAPRRTFVLASAQRDHERTTAGDALVDLLAHYYPGGVREDGRDAAGQPLYSTYLLEPGQIRAAHGLTVSRPAPSGSGQQPVDGVFDWATSPSAAYPFEADLRGVLVVLEEGTYEVALAALEKQQVTIGGRPWSRGWLRPGLYEIGVRAEVDRPIQTRLTWRRNDQAAQPVPLSLLLREGLPTWGVREQALPVPSGQPAERWLPVLWSEPLDPVPPRWFRPSAQPLSRIEWWGEVDLATRGEHRFFLTPAVGASLRVDGRSVAASGGPSPQWRLELAAGRHEVQLIVDAPGLRRFQFTWLGPDGRLRVFGANR